MGKKHKHEEHVNHERWLVSFADMMTLLFALFVVLYAMSMTDLEKMQQLKQSVQWAFHIEGEGKTKDEGIFSQQSGAGHVSDAVVLVTSQKGEMREFLKNQLLDYEEIAGRSLQISPTDDAMSFTAPISDFFEPNTRYPVKREIAGWFEQTLVGVLTYASNIQMLIKMPEVPIGKDPRGGVVTSVDLCIERLKTLERFVLKLPEVRESMVECQWSRHEDGPGSEAWRWEEGATVTISFRNAQGGR